VCVMFSLSVTTMCPLTMCGVCNGDNTLCLLVESVLLLALTRMCSLARCGVCNGDNTLCQGCQEQYDCTNVLLSS
jgi:hypothetical protein